MEMTAVNGQVDPTLGPALLDSLQTARYVDAMETSDAADRRQLISLLLHRGLCQ
jgi:hypothetical protein